MTTRAPKQLRNCTGNEAAPAPLAAPAALRSGATVAYSYRVVRELSQGGMSQLYVVEHLPSTSYAALKVDTRPSSQLLVRERVLLARAKHPNVVRVFDHGQLLDGRHYLILELIPGGDLAAWLDTYGKLTASHALSVLWQLAAAVDHLHSKGVVHSDIKPSNIMLNVLDRHVTLIDFGVAFDFATERVQRGNSGTQGYMAPEQARGEGIVPATDRYAVAAVARELLGLQSRLQSRTRKAPRGRGVSRGQGDSAPISAALRAVFRRALHPRPEERYASARGFVKALERALDAESQLKPAVEHVEAVARVPAPSAPRRSGIVPRVASKQR